MRTTTSGSAENARPSAPIAGLVGLTSRSTTGAKSRLHPVSAIVVASVRAQVRAAAADPAPTVASDARAGNPWDGPKRVTTPPSWSTPIIRPSDPAAARSSRVSAATWAAEATLRAPPPIWSRSNRITPPSPSRVIAVRTHGASARRSPRNPTIRRPATRHASSSTGEGRGVMVGDGAADAGGDSLEAGGDSLGAGEAGWLAAGVLGCDVASGDGDGPGLHAATSAATPPRLRPARTARRDRTGFGSGSTTQSVRRPALRP